VKLSGLLIVTCQRLFAFTCKWDKLPSPPISGALPSRLLTADNLIGCDISLRTIEQKEID
jgi:hypothetical protein